LVKDRPPNFTYPAVFIASINSNCAGILPGIVAKINNAYKLPQNLIGFSRYNVVRDQQTQAHGRNCHQTHVHQYRAVHGRGVVMRDKTQTLQNGAEFTTVVKINFRILPQRTRPPLSANERSNRVRLDVLSATATA